MCRGFGMKEPCGSSTVREIAQKAREMAKKEYDGGIILCILLE